MVKKVNKILHTPNWLFILMAIVLVLRIPTFFEPYSYGDEMIYLSLGEGVRKGLTLYSQIHDNKPPLLYLTAALAGNLLWFKAILATWSLVTIFLFWKFVEVLYPKKSNLQKLATVIFAIYTTIPRLEGHIANAENFMIGFTIAAFLTLLKPTIKKQKLKPKKLVIAGVLFSIATLFKVPAMFDLAAIIFLWVAIAKPERKVLLNIIKKIAYLLTGFMVPILLTLLWYWLRGAFHEYLVAAFLQNVGYLSSWRPGDIREPFLVRNGPLLTRAAIVALAHVILYIYRKKLSRQFMFVSSWLFLTLFAVTLSERPYPHYLLQSVAPISILAAMLVFKKDLEQSLVIIPLTITFLVPVYFDFWHYSTVNYYVRFIKFATGNTTKQQYIKTFGGEVERNYEIAEFVSSNTDKNEKMLVWGDGSAIYALSKRLPPIKFVADYHINDFSTHEEIIKQIRVTMPKVIVILPNSPGFAELDKLVSKNYILTKDVNGATIWILISDRLRSII
ncbi:hypothetical protein JXA63_04485 [Candidatus Woesebacteria bacterium]|nr:hypothetical protein [Candidatus Woesebacteria bacterium]